MKWTSPNVADRQRGMVLFKGNKSAQKRWNCYLLSLRMRMRRKHSSLGDPDLPPPNRDSSLSSLPRIGVLCGSWQLQVSPTHFGSGSQSFLPLCNCTWCYVTLLLMEEEEIRRRGILRCMELNVHAEWKWSGGLQHMGWWVDLWLLCPGGLSVFY